MPVSPTLLLIELHGTTPSGTQRALTQAGYLLLQAEPQDAVTAYQQHLPDLVLLDLSHPEALQAVQNIRKTSNVPLLTHSLQPSLHTKVQALDAGADDCLDRHCPPVELLARLRAQLRRNVPALPSDVQAAGLNLNLESREVHFGQERIQVTSKEFELLELFARSPGRVFSRGEIERRIWPDYQGDSNVIDVYIGYLRRKLEQAGAPGLLRTKRGLGYGLLDEDI